MIVRRHLWLYLIYFTAPIAANADANMSMVLGPGNSSCGSWTDSRRFNDAQALMDEGWFLGYFSAENIHEPDGDLTSGTDSKGLFGWIDSYCQNNPLSDLATAADLLFGQLVINKSATSFEKYRAAHPASPR